MNALSTFFATALLVLLAGTGCDSPPVTETQRATGERPLLQLQDTTPAAQRLVSFVSTIRTGDRAAIEAMIQNEMAGFLLEIPTEAHVSELMGFHPGFTQVRFHYLTRDEPHVAEGLFHNTETDEWVRIGVEVEDAPPHGIVQIELQPAQAPE